MFPFDAILFDIGGVLLTNGWDHADRAAAAMRFGLDHEALEARNSLAIDAWDRGRSDLDAYLDATVFCEPRDFSREEFKTFLFAQSQLLPHGAMPILAELAARNPCLLGSLNNEPRETNEYRFRQFSLRRYFRVAFSSCFMGLRKPEPAIYHRTLDMLGNPPERVLFLDDRVENIAAAQAAGITALRFTGLDALRADLERLGVL